MVEDGGLWQRRNGKQSNFGFGIYKGVFGMTRREEIKQKALSKYPQGTNRYNKFIEGANWADKTMIEKAWDWFYNMALDYMSGDITDVKWGSMKEDFFKAMEE